jgi:hypothetical protein
MQITEEKEPEKASSPAPNAQIWSPSQNDQEVESVLDTKLLDVPETQKDSPTDEPGSGEQKEEAPQQEINISTADYQVSIEPTPNASISTDTHPPDEKQTWKPYLRNTWRRFKNPFPNIYTPLEAGKYAHLGRSTNPRTSG